MNRNYLFNSARIGFREWLPEDQELLTAMNGNAEVMKFFPAKQSKEQTMAFMEQMKQLLAKKGYCYYALDLLETGTFIGFTGLSDKTFPAEFTPCTDIGWRLTPEVWGRGLATEAATRCLHHAFGTLGLAKIHSLAPVINKPSIEVMHKIGMRKVKNFIHPHLAASPMLQPCVLYEVTAAMLPILNG